jgi:two-component system C4-dicarboxylate transport sensor histidine kinase DctB
MSAALSHEINQPLAAVKAYADNADTFLDRDRLPEARENVVSHLQDGRPDGGDLGHLRNFARRPQEDVGPVEVRHDRRCAGPDGAAVQDGRRGCFL